MSPLVQPARTTMDNLENTNVGLAWRLQIEETCRPPTGYCMSTCFIDLNKRIYHLLHVQGNLRTQNSHSK